MYVQRLWATCKAWSTTAHWGLHDFQTLGKNLPIYLHNSNKEYLQTCTQPKICMLYTLLTKVKLLCHLYKYHIPWPFPVADLHTPWKEFRLDCSTGHPASLENPGSIRLQRVRCFQMLFLSTFRIFSPVRLHATPATTNLVLVLLASLRKSLLILQVISLSTVVIFLE